MLENRINTKNRQLSLLLRLAVFIVVLIAFIPFVLAARYAVFSGDDFWIILETFSETGSSYIVKAMQKAGHMYLYWLGDYFCNILQPLLNPLRVFSYTQLRLTLIIILMLSFAGCFYMSYEISCSLGNRKNTIFIFALLLLPILSFRDYCASYLWYIGSTGYQAATFLFSVSAGLTLRCLRRKNRTDMVLACIFILLTTGCALLVGAFAACLLLVALAAVFAESKKVNRQLLVIFIVCVIGNIINVSAPGYYSRHGSAEDFYIFNSIYFSVVLLAKDFLFFIGKPSFLLFMFSAFVLGFSCGRRFKWITVIGVFFGLIVSIIVSLFPVVLGYNFIQASLEELSNTHMYVLDIELIVSCEIFTGLLGSQCSACGLGKNRTNFRKTAAVIFACLFIAALAGIRSCIPVQIYGNLSNGKIQEYSLEWRNNYELMANGVGQDVVITSIPDACVGTHKVSFGSSPDSAANPNLTKYFGMNSVCDGYYYYNHNNTP